MEIYNSWYLKVSQEHSIYYECKWDKNAPPIIFLHGWPWLWFSKKDEVFFTDKNNVIFFDQRWSGKSKYDEGNMLHDNNMDACVSDILTLIDYLNLWNQVMLFWWSWWSTLALVFAIRYPEKVDCLILRWIYLAGERVEEDFCFGNGNEVFFPDAWEDFLSNIPERFHNDKKALSKYIWEQANNWNYLPLNALLLFEYRTAKLDFSKAFSLELSKEIHKQSLLEYYYIYNSCFIDKNYILDNANIIKHIPTHIVQGRYDNVCPPRDAYKLSKVMDKCNLQFTISWHSAYDDATLNALKEIVSKI